MKFCTRCGSRMIDQLNCRVCGQLGYKAALQASGAEYASAGALPPFNYVYRAPLLGPLERERRVVVPFSYINGILLEVRTHEDAAHPIHFKLWSQRDDPCSGPRDPNPCGGTLNWKAMRVHFHAWTGRGRIAKSLTPSTATKAIRFWRGSPSTIPTGILGCSFSSGLACATARRLRCDGKTSI